MKPKAKQNLLVEELPGEVLVYDLDRHRAHSLNPTAAFLLAHADGTREVEELARLLGGAAGEAGGKGAAAVAATEGAPGGAGGKEAAAAAATEEVARLGLERLARARLVEWDGPEAPEEDAGREARGESRRRALRRMALVGIALPVVLTVVAPRAAQALTLISPEQCGAATVGMCCTNRRLCRRRGASQNYSCDGGAC